MAEDPRPANSEYNMDQTQEVDPTDPENATIESLSNTTRPLSTNAFYVNAEAQGAKETNVKLEEEEAVVYFNWTVLLRKFSDLQARDGDNSEYEEVEEKGMNSEQGDRKVPGIELEEGEMEEGEISRKRRREEAEGEAGERPRKRTRRALPTEKPEEGFEFVLDPDAVPALSHLRQKRFQVEIVGCNKETFELLKHLLPHELIDAIRVGEELENLPTREGEVFYVASSVEECQAAHKKLNNFNQKILSVAFSWDYAKLLAGHSISCRSLFEVSDFLLTPSDPKMRGMTYMVAGFSGIQKLELHKKLRGCRLIKMGTKPKRVDLIHQEFNVVEESWDKSLWGIPCTLKNNAHSGKLKAVTDKYELYRTMKRVARDYDKFMPASYDLDDVAHIRLRPGEVMIVKPIGPGAFGGNGISIATSDEELTASRDKILKGGWKKGVICEYMNHPLLFKGRKFHLRFYVLVTSWDEVTPFEKSRILTAGRAYEARNYQDKEIHDTHVGTTEKDYFFPDDFDDLSKVATMKAGLKKISDRMTDAVRGQIKTYQNESDWAYQILALDILFDSEAQPWLLEVNTQPGFNRKTDGPAFDEFQRSLLEWEFKYGIEPKFFSPKGNSHNPKNNPRGGRNYNHHDNRKDNIDRYEPRGTGHTSRSNYGYDSGRYHGDRRYR